MGNLIARLRDEFRHAKGLNVAWDELHDLYGAYDAAPDGSAERLRIGGRMADLYEEVADHLETSRLARLTAALDPASLRAQAAERRAGVSFADEEATS